MQQLNSNAGAWLTVFWDISFECSYNLLGWQFYAALPGEFFAGIWRPDESRTHIKLVAKYRINAPTAGAGVRMFPIIYEIYLIVVSNQQSMLLINLDTI